jgi:ABC-type dipeptide/oligopeptide/nickel transport system permease subunit
MADSTTRRRSASQWAIAWRRFKKNKVALLGFFIIGVYAFLAIGAPFIARYPPGSVEPLFEGSANQPPSLSHPFGTTSEGRDVFSDAVWGTQAAFYVGLVATGISTFIGLLFGLIAGFRGGLIDEVLMRITEVFLLLPALLIILLFARVLVLLVGAGLGLTIIVLILAIFGWPGTARLVRGEVLRVREMEFIQAEKCLGANTNRIVFRHLFPNILSPVIVVTTLGIAGNILAEAGISFLGFGDPNTVTWGQLLNIGFINIVGEWWTEISVGITLLLLVLAFNLLGDGLSDALNPRLRQ